MLAAFILATTLLRNATIIDPASRSVRPGVDVLIREGRIAAIVPTGTISGDQTLDLSGKFLLPGFTDMHAHLFLHPWDENGAIQKRWNRQAILAMLKLFLANGVTTVRDPGSETEAAVTMRKMAAAGEFLSPRIFTAGRVLNESQFDPEPFTPVHDEEDVRREIRWQSAAGVDAIKVYSSMSAPLVKIAIEEAHKYGLPVIGHLQATTWTTAAEMGIDAIEHSAPWSDEYLLPEKRNGYQGDLYGRIYWLENVDLSGSAITKMIATMKLHHVVLDPTLVACHTKFFGDDSRWLRNPANELVPAIIRRGWPAGSFTHDWTAAQYARARAAWPKQLTLIRRMYDAGVMMTVGTDTPTPWVVPGASVHDEMELLHDAGIPAMEVLRMATINPALVLHHETEFGTIATGMKADLVVLERNPVDDIRNSRSIVEILLNGTVYTPAQLGVAASMPHQEH